MNILHNILFHNIIHIEELLIKDIDVSYFIVISLLYKILLKEQFFVYY